MIVQHDFLAYISCSVRPAVGSGVGGEARGATVLADEHHPRLEIGDLMLEIGVGGVRTATELAGAMPWRS